MSSSRSFPNFGYKINRETSNAVYESLQDKVHDDLVIAVALPLFIAERTPAVPFNRWPESDVDTSYNPLYPERSRY